ncbi:MAG: YdeI/OmpD-associated family protein [Candidatus Aminicenantes bacterium]|nr:YdeI/OmpD-associated family protein [Candidatus Aminicenantes bacterium]
MKSRLFRTAAAWRAWLEKNHNREKEIWLAYYKKSVGKKSVTYKEALDEALCHGWIDSTVNRLDTERYMQRWTPRKPQSIWSASNKARIKTLLAEGRMAESGLAAVRIAKKNKSWNKLNDIERIGRGGGPPGHVLAAISSRPELREKFEALSASKKKMLSYWVASAKRPETRTRRIAELGDLIATGRTPGFKAK